MNPEILQETGSFSITYDFLTALEKMSLTSIVNEQVSTCVG
jgi:hypothetical protein